ANEEFTEDKPPESDSLTNGPDDDVPGRLHEHDFEERQRITSHIVGRAAQEKSSPAQEAPPATPKKELVEGWCTSEIARSGIDRHGTKLEGIATHIVRQESKDVSRKVKHHEMGGVFLAHQSTRKQGEPGLHEQHQVSGGEGPGEIGSNPHTSDTISQSERQRLFRRLGLKFLELFSLFRVIRIRLVGRLRNHKGISGRIKHVRSIARYSTGRIRFWFRRRRCSGCCGGRSRSLHL